ncbi:hypothetical protein KC19_11G007900, partial [Ceratodon purpureus]
MGLLPWGDGVPHSFQDWRHFRIMRLSLSLPLSNGFHSPDLAPPQQTLALLHVFLVAGLPWGCSKGFGIRVDRVVHQL